MIKIYYKIISFIMICLSLVTALAHAIDNPGAPVLIGKFNEREKIYLKAIENPANGTDYEVTQILS